MDDWKATTDTTVEQFAIFTSFLCKEGLMGKAVAYLKENDLGRIRVSYAHIKAVQEMIKEHFGDRLTEEGKRICDSIHNVCE